MSKPRKFIITFEDQTVYQAVKYFDSEAECQIWADNVDYYDPASGVHSIDSNFIDLKIEDITFA